MTLDATSVPIVNDEDLIRDIVSEELQAHGLVCDTAKKPFGKRRLANEVPGTTKASQKNLW